MKKNGKIIISGVLLLFAIVLSLSVKVKAVETIDVTGLATGSETSHNCSRYAVSKYDEQYHWRQCSVCGAIEGGKNVHNTVVNTPYGYNCNPATGYKTIRCNGCGYYKTLPKQEHTISTTFIPYGDRNKHYKNCTVCGVDLIADDCRDEQGHLLGCDNYSGKCVICGADRNKNLHSVIGGCDFIQNELTGNVYTIRANIKCMCGKSYGEYTLKTTAIPTETEYVTVLIDAVLSTNFSLPEDIIANFGACTRWDVKPGCPANITKTYYEKSGNTIHVRGSVAVTQEMINSGLREIHLGVWNLQHPEEFIAGGWIHALGSLVPDTVAPAPYGTPVISYDNYVNGYATSATLTSCFYEQYDSLCYVRILDSDKTTVLDNWKAASQNGDYFTSSSNIFIEENSGRTIYVQAKDNTGNTSDLIPVNISKIDTKQPVPVSASSTSTEWSRTKNYTATVTENGSGEVKIAFNDASRYSTTQNNGNIYTKDYIFTGDVYGSTVGAIYFKDAVGNERTQFLSIYNIDNTAPVVKSISKKTAADYRTIEISVTADDINARLNASGSGVSQYCITKTVSDEKTWQSSNKFVLSENGTYYVYTMDAVGNVSAPYEITVSEILTNVQVNIIWHDNENKHLTRPSGVRVNLLRNGVAYKTQVVTGNIKNALWSYTFKNLEINDASGQPYIYTFAYDSIASQKSPSDTYNSSGSYSTSADATVSVLYGITADLKNANTSVDEGDTYGPASDAEEVGYTIKGNIQWKDNEDILGYRPDKVKLTVLKDGEVFTEAILYSSGKSTDSFKFTNLPKYNESLEVFQYSVVESFESWYVVDGEIQNAYSTDGDKKTVVYVNGDICGVVNFTNTFVAPSTPTGEPVPVIPGSPRHNISVLLKHNQPDTVCISIKMFETFYDTNGKESYGGYNGIEYKAPVNSAGLLFENLPAGKYEISCEDSRYDLAGITLDNTAIKIDGNYVCIPKTNIDINATINLNLKKRNFIGFNDKTGIENYFGVIANTTKN